MTERAIIEAFDQSGLQVSGFRIRSLRRAVQEGLRDSWRPFRNVILVRKFRLARGFLIHFSAAEKIFSFEFIQVKRGYERLNAF